MLTPVTKNEGRTVVFGPCRLSYTHLFSKFSHDGDPDKGKYMTNVLIPKSERETVKAIKDAIEAAKNAGIAGKWHGKEPKKLEQPLRDGDIDREDDVYSDHYYINAKCATRPGVIDRNRTPIVDEEEIYSGVWALVSVTFYPYEVSGKKGVAVGLNNVMKFKDGERLGGRSSAESDFADIDTEDDDDL